MPQLGISVKLWVTAVNHHSHNHPITGG